MKILKYEKKYKHHFYDINKEWISSMFIMEDVDEKVLSDPEKYILKTGGYIWFAIDDKLGFVGVCALRKVENEYELTKMGVYAKARGLKIGEQLLKYVITFIKENQISCFLLTNKKCEAAIHLYLKNGFNHNQELLDKYGATYDRCDVAMRLSTVK